MTTQQQQVDLNYEAFMKQLPDIIKEHRNKAALMKDGEIIGYYSTTPDAVQTGDLLFKGQPFSVQLVTDGAIDLGFFSHASHLR